MIGFLFIVSQTFYMLIIFIFDYIILTLNLFLSLIWVFHDLIVSSYITFILLGVCAILSFIISRTRLKYIVNDFLAEPLELIVRLYHSRSKINFSQLPSDCILFAFFFINYIRYFFKRRNS